MGNKSAETWGRRTLDPNEGRNRAGGRGGAEGAAFLLLLGPRVGICSELLVGGQADMEVATAPLQRPVAASSWQDVAGPMSSDVGYKASEALTPAWGRGEAGNCLSREAGVQW